MVSFIYNRLHKAIYSYQEEFLTNKDTSKFVTYFLKKISLLTSYKIKPILVFDGAKLPIKEDIEKKRESNREKNLKKYEELKEKGLVEEANKKYISSIDVTPKMAYKVIKEIKRINIEYLVSPYEADAQISYLSKIGYIFGAISEDSDLLVYGCDRVFYKMDNQGYGYEICIADLPRCKELDFKLFSSEMFLKTCILAGCDYLESVNGIAFKKAHKLISEHKDVQNVLNYLRKNKFDVPDDYETKFEIAFLTFKFQTVYCPLQKVFKPFNDIVQETLYTSIHSYKDRSFLGK
jgi:exonuclease-1